MLHQNLMWVNKPALGGNFSDVKLQAINRWWNLMRYHRPSQLLERSAKTLRTHLARPRLPSVEKLGTVQPRSDRLTLAKIASRRIRAWEFKSEQFARNLGLREITYLHHTQSFSNNIDWRVGHADGVSDLWRFHIHYQDDLLAVLAQPNDKGLATSARTFQQNWIVGNFYEDSRTDRDAWHPFCISRRIINWILTWEILWSSVAAQPIEREKAARVLDSLALQTRFLSEHLEWDLRGNHLLVNLHALAIAAAFFEGDLGARCLQTVRKFLPLQLQEQILPSGEHFERVPMYHAQMLEAVLDLRDALASLDPGLAQQCSQTGKRMAAFIAAIRHPDQGIPLLGDSALDETPDLNVLIDAGHPDATSLSVAAAEGASCTGEYWTFRDGGDFLLFDAGPVGADELPAHAHCDLLGLEASLAGQRVFVDSGVFDYEDSPQRQYCRGTSGHNVLQVGQREQCDVWSKFRMGARGKPVFFDHGSEAEWHWASAAHNAYNNRDVCTVGRWLACRSGGPWLGIDWAEGHSEQVLTLRWHLHPAVHAERRSEHEFVLSVREVPFAFRVESPGSLSVESYQYHSRFGSSEPAQVIVWTSLTKLPAGVIWSVQRLSKKGRIAVDDTAQDVCLRWSDTTGAESTVRVPLTLRFLRRF